MMKLLSIYKILLIATLFVGFYMQPVKAAVVTITQNQALSFGTFSLGSFASVATITVRDDGTFTTSGPVAILVNPTRGEYTLDAGIGEAGTVYTVGVPATLSLTGPGSSFTMYDITVRPTTLVFDGSGQDDITVGAKLDSAGDGNGFNGGTFSANLILDVQF